MKFSYFLCFFLYYYLFHILHPLSHLAVAHFVDLLDELIVFLPESHLGAGLNSTVCKWE